MCGFVGIWHPDGPPIDLRLVGRTCRLIRHRGPDDEGFLLVNSGKRIAQPCGGPDTPPSLDLPPLEDFFGHSFDLALGFRRLAILDPSERGHQPMATDDGGSWIVFNGEVYNYIELRSELERAGQRFHTDTDTEVILNAYRKWGHECLLRFIGMWALCIWDAVDRRLFLARDPFGIKPLYYWRENEKFAFASEIKALLEISGVERQARSQRLYDYLRFGWTDHGADTMFEKIHQVPSGHWIAISADHPQDAIIERYWDLPTEESSGCSREEAASRLRKLFLNSVNLHLRSDVPVGSALSGGIDSSSIVMGIRRLRPEAFDVLTVSHIDVDPTVREERWVDLITQASGAHPHKVTPHPEDLLSDLAELVGVQDEPFSSTSIYAQFRVFQLARKLGVKVMLDGQGADEMLGGYPSYLSARLASLLAHGHWIRAAQFFSHIRHLPNIDLRSTMIRTGGLMLPRSFEGVARNLSGESFVPSWMSLEWVRRNSIVPTPLRVRGDPDVLRAQLREALLQRSLPSLLRYEDRNSMAASVESRLPFLTTEIVEFVFSLPEEHLISPLGTSKSIFREAMRGIVPDAILDRKDKIGFATSEHSWLLALRPVVNTVLESETAKEITALNHDVVCSEADAALSPGKHLDPRIWRWLSTVLWAERYSVSF